MIDRRMRICKVRSNEGGIYITSRIRQVCLLRVRLTLKLGKGMRRADKNIRSKDEINEIIRGSQVCRIAMATNNMPYMVPVSFGYDGESIYIHTAREGKKLDIFNENNNVCFEFERNITLYKDPENACEWSFSFGSVIGFGNIFELESSEDIINGLNQIMSQYSGKEWIFREEKLNNVRVWRIKINSVTGKRSVIVAT
jgi:uncharacterized protein